MKLLCNRSLIVDEEKLTKTELNFVLKHTCNAEGCGTNFDIKITKQKFDEKGPEKRRYIVRCHACRKRTTFSQAQADRFERLFGIKAVVEQNNFGDIFDLEE